MKNRNYAKKILKFRVQKDWTIALVVTLTFIMMQFFDNIDWKWYWLISPIWMLLSIYLVCTIIGMTWYFLFNKKK